MTSMAVKTELGTMECGQVMIGGGGRPITIRMKGDGVVAMVRSRSPDG